MKGQRTQVRSLVRCSHLAPDGVFKVMMKIVILDRGSVWSLLAGSPVDVTGRDKQVEPENDRG
jgi:hypothetical protein